jgi:hypothetical protein
MGRESRPLHPAAALGVAGLLAGCVAWAWLGDWRWAVTGVAALVVGAVGAAVRGKGQA